MGRSSIAAIILIASWALCAQETYERNDLPCVAEICLGDSFSELQNIKWERARHRLVIAGRTDYADSHDLSPAEIKRLKAKYRGAVIRAGGYLATESFDQKGLPLIAGVNTACTEAKLNGTFTTSSGNPTKVTISLLPNSEDASTQRWTVVAISRKIPEVVSAVQKGETTRQLKERYARFDAAKGIQKTTDGVFSVDQGSGILPYGFTLLLRSHQNQRYKLHPECGGADKISID